MPSKQASNWPENDGHAIQMDPRDHRKTASHSGGVGSEQAKYREKQKQLIEDNKFEEAFLMDVDDVTGKWPGKYDDAILEAIDELP
ncbi:MAG: hypothetical protein KC646_04040 [Candidatus Cloacimonetes bacterium]|nr:hypothetical protein [Candidatus Cloacimonadota bacterium]